MTASAALTLTIVKANGSINVSSYIKSAAQKLSDRFGDMYDAASNAISSALHAAGNSLSGITVSLTYNFIRGTLDLGSWLNGIGDFFGDLFNRAKKWTLPRDPLILDHDGDGLETVGPVSNVYLDHDGDGVLSQTGWVGKDDALLVWERDGNGTIDTGAELIGIETLKADGSKTTDGFDVLVSLDSNADGQFNASDAQYATTSAV